MKLFDAIELAKKKKRRLYNDELDMIAQDAKSLLHWIIVDTDGDEKKAAYQLHRFLKSDKWELEGPSKEWF